MNKKKLIIWDVDGTLLNTGEGIMASLTTSLTEAGMTPPPIEDLRTFVGPPVHDSLKKYYNLTEERATELTVAFRNIYSTPEYLFKAEPYDGILGVMQTLQERGYKQAVATYKREDYALAIVEHFGMAQYCDVVHGADQAGVLKKSDIIKLCIDFFPEIKKDEIVMIGDTIHDQKGAEAIGVDFIPVGYGFGFSDGCKQPSDILLKLN